MVFLEALRQLQFIEGKQNVIFIHVALVPSVGGSEQTGEQKTKPTQHSVKALTSVGIFPDILVCRCTYPLSESTKKKLSIFCQVPPENVISMHNISNIYHVPHMLLEQNAHVMIQNVLFAGAATNRVQPQLGSWEQMAHALDNLGNSMTIAIVGKYTGVGDTYLSVLKSITHSGVKLNVDVKVIWINSTDLEPVTKEQSPDAHKQAWRALTSDEIAGIIIPGGFGVRGIEGKILAANYARTNRKPCLGLCLGMQVMTIEYARNVMGQQGANSVEFDENAPFPAIIYMPETDTKGVAVSNNELGANQPMTTKDMGGTMRLGSRATYVNKFLLNGEPSLAWELYDCEHRARHSQEDNGQVTAVVYERYRHRYEVNPGFIGNMEGSGLYFSGRGFAEGDDSLILNADIMTVDDQQQQQSATVALSDSDCNKTHKLCRMEIVELPRSVHPYYTGGQFHPEYKSRPDRPAPLFYGFIKASLEQQQLHAQGSTTAATTEEAPQTPSKRLRLPDLGSAGNTDEEVKPTSARKLSRTMSARSEAVAGVCSPIKAWKERESGLDATSASTVLTSSRTAPQSGDAME
jgi:CTP synthase